MMNVHTVRSTMFWFFLGTTACTAAFVTGIVFSPSAPSPGLTPSSNLTLILLGLDAEGVSRGPAGVKSCGVLRFRFAESAVELGSGRLSGSCGLKEDCGGEWGTGSFSSILAGVGAAGFEDEATPLEEGTDAFLALGPEEEDGNADATASTTGAAA